MADDLIARLRHSATLCDASSKALQRLLTDASDALEAAREDAVCAERYRWLRCGGWEVMQDPKYWRPELRFDGAIAAANLDTQITALQEAA